ncbi:hypothetical protein ELI44_05225 [Rhizobium ruizarguesonis]|uniref:hypothetical protein n=1 Tax=Rhizobium ruizarguesonis TaxID=2081791 RepID=UPI001031FFF6|nr:hypothetical protein [Rhizobium ruizarguesonis]TAU47464.1 hypothetical protein ELI42_05200 [Rhizobium ruizarguesonis]TAU62534.1 hypothetical protein ELI44_05225 [Rhizobium ruizarguesonis]
MTMIDERTPITREGIIADLRRLADLAEASGDRVSAVRALKWAWRIERFCPVDPAPPPIDRIIEVCETIGPLVRRFTPEDAERLSAAVRGLRQCHLEFIAAERENVTLH